MKRLLSWSLRWALITLVLGTVVYAAYSKSVTNTFTVVSPPAPTITLVFYADAQATQEITGLAWGSMAQGATASQTFYIKNAGNVGVSISVTSDLSNQIGTVAFTNPGAIAIGAVVSVQQTLTIKVNGTLGAGSFQTIVNAQ